MIQTRARACGKRMGGAFKPYRRASEAHIAPYKISRQNKIRSKLK